MNEFQAALGLLQLRYIDEALACRATIDGRYREAIREIQGLSCVSNSGQQTANYSYFPILVGDDYPLSRDKLYYKLKDHGINARRYFYPLISQFAMYRCLPSASANRLSVAADIASRVICLPIYPDLAHTDQESIIELLLIA
jgi:dTDP-4-amino-4,6-dideoxygalactose transaminase